MQKIPVIISAFMILSSILFSCCAIASVTQCPDNPSKATPDNWSITQPLPTTSGFFTQATIIGDTVFCHYSPQQGYFGSLYSLFQINTNSLNPHYWSLKNCSGMGSLCCIQSAASCSFQSL